MFYSYLQGAGNKSLLNWSAETHNVVYSCLGSFLEEASNPLGIIVVSIYAVAYLCKYFYQFSGLGIIAVSVLYYKSSHSGHTMLTYDIWKGPTNHRVFPLSA